MLCNIYGIIDFFFSKRVAPKCTRNVGKKRALRTHIPSHAYLHRWFCMFLVCFCSCILESVLAFRAYFMCAAESQLLFNENVSVPFFVALLQSQQQEWLEIMRFVAGASLKCDEQNIVIYIFKIFIENCGQLWLHNICVVFHLAEHALRASPSKFTSCYVYQIKIYNYSALHEFSRILLLVFVLFTFFCAVVIAIVVVVEVGTFKNVVYFRWFWHLMYHQAILLHPCFHFKSQKINRLRKTGIYVNGNGIL